MARRPLVLQTLVFPKARFSAAEASAWARAHHHRAGDPESTARSWRIRQRSPLEFAPGSFRTVHFGKGIEAIYGHLKSGHADPDPGTIATIDELYA